MKNGIIFFLAAVLSLSAPCVRGEGTEGGVSDAEKAVMDGNARLISLLLPEIEGIVENETVSIKDKLDKIKERAEHEEEKRTAVKNGAKAAFEKAQNLADIGNMKEAGFYYSIACASDPEEGLYLYGYVNAVIAWADRNIKSGRPEAALKALSDIERFLYSNTPLILPSNAESVVSLLKRIESKIDEAGKAAFSKNYNTGLDSLKEIMEESERLIASDIPDGLDNVTSYQAKLQTLASRLMKFAADDSGENVFPMIKKLSFRINETAAREEAERTLEKGVRLLDSFESSGIDGLRAAEDAAVINQRLYMLSFGASPDLKRRIDIFGKRFKKLSLETAKTSGNAVVARLRGKYAATAELLKKDGTNAEKAVERLYALQDEIVSESSGVSDAESVREIRGLAAAVNSDIETWRGIQQERYEKWAVKTVIKFNDLYKNEMGMLGSGRDTKNRIYLGMKDYLCPIDVKYLGVPGLRAYTEVFDFFYKELDRDQRLDLSAEFISCDKKSLSEF